MSETPNRLRRFLDPYPARQRPHHLRNGIAAIAVLVFLSYCAVTGNIPIFRGVPGTPVRAEFSSVNNIDKRTPVRVDGVNVGKVQKVQAGSDPLRSSVVTLRITNHDVKVHSDARASIRWKTLLGGQVYVDLDPGSPSAPPLGGGTIPMSRTSSQVEIDQVLQSYPTDTRQNLRAMFKGLSKTFADPRGVSRTVDTLPALRTIGRGMKALRGQYADDVSRLVSSTAKTVSALGHDTNQLQGLVIGAQRTLAATDDRRRDLGAMMALAPSTLAQTNVTMTRLRTTLGHLDPLVADVRPGARALAPAANAARPALDQARAVLAEAQPLLRDAQPTFAGLQRASDSGVPLLHALDPTVRRLQTDTLPFLYKPDDETKLRTYEEIGPFFSSLDQGEFDARGYRIRVSAPAGDNTVMTMADTSMARSCRRDLPATRAAECSALARAVVRAWLGKGKR